MALQARLPCLLGKFASSQRHLNALFGHRNVRLLSVCHGRQPNEVFSSTCLHKQERRLSSQAPTPDVNTSWWDPTRLLLRLLKCGIVAGGIAGLTLFHRSSTSSDCEESPEVVAGSRRADLPDFRLADISKHKNKDVGLWVTFKNGVYNITDFSEGHPGGDKILMAAGGALEPFWELYAAHKTPEVFEMLEELRIGNVHPEDLKAQPVRKSNDPFANDPNRHPALKVNSEKPFNAEPPPSLTVDNFITPNELFFVRNHLPVPRVDIKKFNLEVSGEGIKRPIKLTIDELKKKFKVHTVTVAIQCAGNRRAEMTKYKAVKGLSWTGTAISNAEWTGVKLSDILQYVGAKEEDVEHVQFEGLDKDPVNDSYGASIPAGTAFDPRKDVLIAFAMNGKELPLDHGYPLRVVVPGVVGARQVKWLSRIVLSKQESQSHWQQNDYKSFNPSIDWSTLDFSKSPAIQEYPIQSAICEPADGATLPDPDEVTIKGYAYSGGGRGIIRLDVSVDGGKSWQCADLHHAKQPIHRQWGWTLWEATIPVPKDHKGQLEIVAKAVDSSHNSQPDTCHGIWNVRGLINNAWHRINVNVPKE